MLFGIEESVTRLCASPFTLAPISRTICPLALALASQQRWHCRSLGKALELLNAAVTDASLLCSSLNGDKSESERRGALHTTSRRCLIWIHTHTCTHTYTYTRRHTHTHTRLMMQGAPGEPTSVGKLSPLSSREERKLKDSSLTNTERRLDEIHITAVKICSLIALHGSM